MIAIAVRPRFSVGPVFITANAEAKVSPEDVPSALQRHARGDWGELCADDMKQNERSLHDGGRLVSVYHDRRGVKFYIITEPDRSSTTVLLPEDY